MLNAFEVIFVPLWTNTLAICCYCKKTGNGELNCTYVNELQQDNNFTVNCRRICGNFVECISGGSGGGGGGGGASQTLINNPPDQKNVSVNPIKYVSAETAPQ